MRLKHAASMGGLALLCLALLAQPALAELVEGYYVKSVKDLGEKLILSDDSEWDIPGPDDRDLVYNWLPGQTVAIRDGKVLINTIRGDQVDGEQTKGPAPKAAAATAAPTPTGGSFRPASPASPSPAMKDELIRIHQRLDGMDNKLRILDWRMRQLENQLTIVPPVKQ